MVNYTGYKGKSLSEAAEGKKGSIGSYGITRWGHQGDEHNENAYSNGRRTLATFGLMLRLAFPTCPPSTVQRLLRQDILG